MTNMQLEHKDRSIQDMGGWRMVVPRYIDIPNIEAMSIRDIYQLVSEIAVYKDYDMESQAEFSVYNHPKFAVETKAIRYAVIPFAQTYCGFILVAVYFRYIHKGGTTVYTRKVFEYRYDHHNSNIWQPVSFTRLGTKAVAVQIKKDLTQYMSTTSKPQDYPDDLSWEEHLENLSKADYCGKLHAIGLQSETQVETLINERNVEKFLDIVFDYTMYIRNSVDDNLWEFADYFG